jgi:predicted membrane channel-forming protein YqfA (hemolysin III family)
MGEPQGYDRKEFLYRIGTFFLLVGTGLLIFFMLSEAAKQTVFSFFCWSMILLVIGFVFRAQYKKPSPPPSGRFSIFKRFKRNPKEEKK